MSAWRASLMWRTTPVLKKYSAVSISATKSREQVFSQIEEILLSHFDINALGDQNEMSEEELQDILSKSRKNSVK